MNYDAYIPRAWPRFPRPVLSDHNKSGHTLPSVLDRLQLAVGNYAIDDSDPENPHIEVVSGKICQKALCDLFMTERIRGETEEPPLALLTAQAIGNLILADYHPPNSLTAHLTGFGIARKASGFRLRGMLASPAESPTLSAESLTLVKNIWRLGHPHDKPALFRPKDSYRPPPYYSLRLNHIAFTDPALYTRLDTFNKWIADLDEPITVRLGPLSIGEYAPLSVINRRHIAQNLTRLDAAAKAFKATHPDGSLEDYRAYTSEPSWRRQHQHGNRSYSSPPRTKRTSG